MGSGERRSITVAKGVTHVEGSDETQKPVSYSDALAIAWHDSWTTGMSKTEHFVHY